MHLRKSIIVIILMAILTTSSYSQIISGLKDKVEIYKDPYGISHIYAENEEDLFFAQGYSAAQDRLFQFEIWRRQATGTVSEILGEKELKRDIGTRLFQFRGNMDDEMNHYHPKGKLIIESFVKGVNAYIGETEKNVKLLPMEFGLLGIKPQKWTPRDVISRHQGLLGNIGQELNAGRLVAMLGEDKLKDISWFHPKDPKLEMDKKINQEALSENILELYNAYRRPISFKPEDLIASARIDNDSYRYLAKADQKAYELLMEDELESIGSNNWVVSGEHTQSGYPIMANDPHRTLASPSLRYMVHLVGPGWNVIGGGEPEIPGISIGHNEHGAWGLTVYRTDAEDLYVYEINPKNKNQYKYKGQWVDMQLIQDKISVKGQSAREVTYKYTFHGPVVYEDSKRNIAYAVRCGWLEVGGSPYLASLRMDQAKTWEEFREACNYSNIPGENMIWADREGNIGWQAVGIAPVRKHFSGMVPIPGDGSHEWEGYLPIIEKPHSYNPASGMIITANEDVTPKDYDRWDAVGYNWGDTYRGDRLAELLKSGRVHSISDMEKYQTDYLAIASRLIVPMYASLSSDDDQVNKAIKVLLSWNNLMRNEEIGATIYFELEQQLKKEYELAVVPEKARSLFSPQMKKVMDWLKYPDASFGKNPISDRNMLLLKALKNSMSALEQKLGKDISAWQYGQLDYKHVLIKHPLSNAVNDSLKNIIDVGPVARGGYGLTVNNSSNNMNQRSGASFRIIVDTENWDHTSSMNSPGQSGDPENPFYDNLFEMWSQDKFFPLYFSEKKVKSTAVSKITLIPK